MRRDIALFLVLAFMGSLVSPLLFAAEMTDAEKAEVAAEVERGIPEEDMTAPTESLVAPTPSVDLIEGTVTAVDLESDTPNLTVKTADGQESTVYLDFETSAVWKGNQEFILEDLAAGQAVKVRYVESEGKKTAKTIEIAE